MEEFFALSIAAIVKAVELANKKDWKSLGKIVLSALIGTGAGLLGLFGLNDPMTGLFTGLSLSGLVTVVGYAGEKAKTKVTVKETV